MKIHSNILIIIKCCSFSFNNLLTLYIFTAWCLECYVCKNQEDNQEKCTKTLKTCEHYEDMCMTEISWGS